MEKNSIFLHFKKVRRVGINITSFRTLVSRTDFKILTLKGGHVSPKLITLFELLLELPFKHSIIVYSDSFQKNIGFTGFIPTDFSKIMRVGEKMAKNGLKWPF